MGISAEGNCKWCAQGQCWTHAGAKGGGKGSGWTHAGAKGGGKGSSPDVAQLVANVLAEWAGNGSDSSKGGSKGSGWQSENMYSQGQGFRKGGDAGSGFSKGGGGSGCQWCAHGQCRCWSHIGKNSGGSKGAGQWIQVGKGAGKAFGQSYHDTMVAGKAFKKEQNGLAYKKVMEKLNKIEPEKKVWIGGLSKTLTWKQLEKHIQLVTGNKPKTTDILNPGTACCAFADAEEALAAQISAHGTELDGQVMKVDAWSKETKTVGGPVGDKTYDKKLKKFKRKLAATGHADAGEVDGVDASLRVWVGDLSPKFTVENLKKHFADNGSEADIVVRWTQGTACVTFKSEPEVVHAITALTGTELDGKALQVDVWTEPTYAKKAKVE